MYWYRNSNLLRGVADQIFLGALLVKSKIEMFAPSEYNDQVITMTT